MNDETSMTDVFPSVKEILPESVRRRLTGEIIQEITERYEKFGPKYIGPLNHPDGRRINMCMLNDSAQDAIEEVVDAIFNVSVLFVKRRSVMQLRMLKKLAEIYDELKTMKVKNEN